MDVRNACEFLRSFGRKIINERLALVEDGVDLPNDILTNILKSTSKKVHNGQVLNFIIISKSLG